ncbi:hypothetical protein OCU04_002906 [Sclerotinia nivalis]|uniref:Uncharacterized protein n=1 Tax=Sclerotinia nivalis TaxID=352851 RepID=A0A9X0DMN6_9HELO|nr:hypothetical protein OCU04_002906 [Sclerotinia nivalis]
MKQEIHLTNSINLKTSLQSVLLDILRKLANEDRSFAGITWPEIAVVYTKYINDLEPTFYSHTLMISYITSTYINHTYDPTFLNLTAPSRNDQQRIQITTSRRT